MVGRKTIAEIDFSRDFHARFPACSGDVNVPTDKNLCVRRNKIIKILPFFQPRMNSDFRRDNPRLRLWGGKSFAHFRCDLR